jgi:hypothetical protein
MLVVGTLSIVHPAAALSLVALRNGARLIEVTPLKCPYLGRTFYERKARLEHPHDGPPGLPQPLEVVIRPHLGRE